MPRIFRTHEARLDYDEIWSYLALRDLAAADRLVDRLDVVHGAREITPEYFVED